MREREAQTATTQMGRLGAEDPSGGSARDSAIQVAQMLGAVEHRSERSR